MSTKFADFFFGHLDTLDVVVLGKLADQHPWCPMRMRKVFIHAQRPALAV